MTMLIVLVFTLLVAHPCSGGFFVSSVPIRPETTASCTLRSVQESANLNASADLLLARVQVQRGLCNTPVCRCSVDLGAAGGGVRELQVNYPWFAYEGGIQVLGHSPSHTLYQEVSVQLVDDFGASLFEQDLNSFLDNLTYPDYFTNGLDPGYSMSADRARATKQEELEKNKTDSNDEAFERNNNFTNDFNTTILDQSRRRQRARLRRRRQSLSFESQEEEEMDDLLLALEQRVERNLLEWAPPDRSFGPGQWTKVNRRRRGLLQDNSESDGSLFEQVLKACTDFGDRAQFIANNSMALTNTANNISNVDIITGLTVNNETELENNRNLNIQNCLTDRYQQIASYCVGLELCVRNEVERLRLDLQLREQSIYQNELLAMRNFINLIEDSKVADLDFKAEFANALEQIANISSATADANQGLRALFDEIRAGEDNLYEFAEVIKNAYMQMSGHFTESLESQQTDLETFRGVVTTAVLEFQQYEEAWNTFIEGVDRTINRNSLYMLRLTNKGRTMSNIWKNLLKLLRKIMDGSALKPYLTRGIQTLYQGNLDGGWTPMLFEPPRPPLDWVDENGTRVKLYSGIYSWSTITQSAPFGGHTGGLGAGEDMLLVKKRLDLVCDLVELTFQELNIDSFSQYLYLFGPPGCVPFQSCTCFLLQTEYVSNDLPLNHLFAARQLLQNLPVLYQETEEFKSFFTLSPYPMQAWAFDTETNGTGRLPALTDYTLRPPQEGGSTRNGLGVYAVEGWELILNRTVQDPLAVQELLGAEWSCSLGAAPLGNSNASNRSSSPRPVDRANRNWFYDNWCLQNASERLSAWTNASTYWLPAVNVQGEAFQNFTSLLLDDLADRCLEASGRIADPWNHTYDNSKPLQDFFVDIVPPAATPKFSHRFWGPGFGFDGLFGHLRAGLVRGEAPVLTSFLTPEMYRAQLLAVEQPAETELRVCNGSISQLNVWDNPVLSHAWGYWRNALLVNTGLDESELKEYLFAPEELSSVRTAAALFWQTLDELAVGFMIGLQTDLYEASLGELPVPLFHAQRRSYLQTSHGQGEAPPEDQFEVPLKGGVEGDELTFRPREARMLRTETAGMLSASPDASPLWALRGLRARTQATTFTSEQDAGAPVRGVRLAVGSGNSPPAELLVAGYWSCWDQPCPQRVTLLDKVDGRIEETASYREPQALPPCVVPSDNATEEEVTAAILGCPFFGGRASTAKPADGLFPYVLDLPQELLRSALSPSFEGRLYTPFYLFEPSEPELVLGTQNTDADLLQGPVFRRKTRHLGDYVQLSKGRFHVEGGQRNLGQHIARLRKGLPVCLEDNSGAPELNSSSCLLSLPSLEKSCIQAKSIDGLCSLLTRFYPSLRRTKGEQAPEDSSVRLYPKQWTQDVTLAIPLDSEKGQQPALTFPPAPFETECPEFKVSQEGDSGWRVSVLPLQAYAHDFVLSVSGCTSQAPAPPPRLLTLPPPLSSASWFIGYCGGEEAAVSVTTRGVLPSEVVCTRLQSSVAVASPPSLSLVGSNAQALVIEGKDYLATNIRSLGTAISNALYEGNDWDGLQAKLGEWVNTLPFVFDADGILEDLDALIERINNEIEALVEEVAENKSRVQKSWEEYQDSYRENQEQYDNITDLHAELRVLFDQTISSLYDDIKDYKENVRGAYEQYGNSEPFFYFFGDVTEDYSAYELAFQLLAQDPPVCITDADDVARELSTDECPYYFYGESCAKANGGVGLNSFLYWLGSTSTLLSLYFLIGLSRGLRPAATDETRAYRRVRSGNPRASAEMSSLLGRGTRRRQRRHEQRKRRRKGEPNAH